MIFKSLPKTLFTLILLSNIVTQHTAANSDNVVLADLEPACVWKQFAELCTIPRASFNEFAVGQYILNIATEHGLSATRDSRGNIIVQKPASHQAFEQSPIVVLQSHMDMVTEKFPDIEHDFVKDPIKLIRNGNYIGATGTTLGADDGIGVAAMIAIMIADDIAHGPLEFLFTVEEESGFGGAKNLTASTLHGRILLNLDAEELDTVYIGCAGGYSVLGELPIAFQPLEENHTCLQLTIGGLRGGHSGVEIHLQRGHALRILGTLLNLLEQHQGKLISLSGGNKRNALPRDAYAIIALPSQSIEQFQPSFEALANMITQDISSYEPDAIIAYSVVKSYNSVMAKIDQDRIIALLHSMPHGVIAMSKDSDELVETSTNFARIYSTEDRVIIETTQRSLVETEKLKAAHMTIDCLHNAGASTTVPAQYPGWTPNPNSKVLHYAKKAYQAVFGTMPLIKTIHAGLECGEIGQRIPDMDMIAFGPTIIGAHSPSEQIEISTVQPFWEFLKLLLGDLASHL